MSRRELIFVTRNSNKVREARAILAPIAVRQEAMELEEIQGDEEAISRHKILQAAQRLGRACFIEDTSLRFDALGGLPGPFVHYFLERVGPEGLWMMLKGFASKQAEAVVTIGFREFPSEGEGVAGSSIRVFKGSVRGEIVAPRGGGGFGWDVIFQPEGHTRTFGEMSAEEKNAISHRARAFLALRDFLLRDHD